ncbi:MAG TPA: DNA-formamidopyrimidine glycosylase family protein [Vicinamibacterales bacterium]|jgi:endonuclease-8|nr:DNA-formamidopyrimidine glycosylase family protein [Vicinamibacterales bacterium]
MPEGDSIFRAARALHRALAGRTITRFDSVFPRLTNPRHADPLAGRTIDRVEARGKHLLMWFSGGLVLRTHMRMHGSWHLYRPDERWQRPRRDMRIVIETADVIAVGFNVPAAEWESDSGQAALRALGPDLLGDDFDAGVAVQRLQERGEMEIADALLDQTALAGIGNIWKSETLFATRVNPFVRVSALTREQLDRIVAAARTLLRASVSDTWHGVPKRVYGRAGKPCPRCGTGIERTRHGPDVRSTYWCPRCQPMAADGEA